LAVAYKPNFAFYEALGADGWKALAEVRALIPATIPVIADAKRGDIGNTSAAYAKAILDVLAFDAVTVSPYMGWDSVARFMEYADKGVFVLGRTSNPGARDFQDIRVDGEELYMRVAREVMKLDAPADVGLVLGAGYPEALRRVRSLGANLLVLVPGVGAQGDAEVPETIAAGANDEGDNAVLSVSRHIMFASADRGYASAIRAAATRLARDTWSARESNVAPR